jgi:peroxiredoxin Q/BCP
VEVQDQFVALGSEVIGVGVDRPEVALAYARAAGARFSFIGNPPGHTIARAYGVLSERYSIYRRVTFVIDSDGIVRAVIRHPHDMRAHSREALAAVRALVGQGPPAT